MSSTLKDTFFQNTGSSGKSMTGNEVVISGIAGLFPQSDSVQEFMENLYNKVDMVTTKNSRWVSENNEMPKHFGFVKDMNTFDAQFFKVHYKQARCFESMGRKLLESTYAAIFDSGTNPMNLRGKNVGVFIGTSSSESEKTDAFKHFFDNNGFGISGICRTMFANRISYWLDTKGPSYALDTSCSSGLMCIEQAYKNIIDGYCEAAIVGCSNYCMHPSVTLNYKRAGFLCMDGKTKSFDMNGDGYVRSDSINVFFLQKAKDAKRIYAEVSLIAGTYSLTSGNTFMPIRDVKYITNFFNKIYSATDISTDEIEYIEGYAAGLSTADLNELEAIGKIFGKSKSIKVGSVKSNMGNSEAASSANALIKLCLSYHKGKIPANLHYYSPPNHIPEVREGKVQVLQDHSSFNRGYTAMNSFSVNGYDMHLVLKGHLKNKDLDRYQTTLPYLITISGRQETCVLKIIGDLKKQNIDYEQIALLHNIHNTNINGHMCRGYIILEKDVNEMPKCLAEKIEYYPAVTRPIWFLYSGMGSQWAGMGAELMRIPTFANAIYKCHSVLEPKGIDIIEILTDQNEAIYDNILNSFIGIAAIQIGLTDILKEMGINPDNIIGHSVGELGCAYADGCLTAEEMILSAYSRGLVSIQTPFIKGSMAAVGLGYSDVRSICPPEIEVACHNSSESATISGPADAMKQFVLDLTSLGVFAKEVPCSNIPYHSRYIAAAGPELLKYLKNVITDPKQRSGKWLSTSVPKHKWHEPIAQYSSAEYHTNNLLNPVLFEETFKLIPSNAIVIEIAPHGLLQAIIKRSHSECTHIPLTRRGHPDPVKYLLEAFGEMYTIGMNPKLEAIYPKVEFPVSTETAMLSHLVQWEHSEHWPHCILNTKDRTIIMERQFIMSIYEDDYSYLAGHIRNGQCVFPETGLLVLVWETFAMAMKTDFRKMSVKFNDVKFSGEVIIQKEIPLELNIMINKGNMFEVSFEQTTIVSGYIKENKIHKLHNKLPSRNENQELNISTKDIYKLFCVRGHTYRNDFQSIQSINANIDRGIVKWNNNWTTFLDGLIQLSALARGENGALIPKLIRQLVISINRHNETKWDSTFEDCFDIHLDRILNTTRCDGVEIRDIAFMNCPNIEQYHYLQTKLFFPHKCSLNINMDTAVQILLQIVKENLQTDVIKVTEIKSNINNSEHMSSKIKHIAQYIPNTEFVITTTVIENIDNRSVLGTNLLIIHDSFDDITNLINQSGTMAMDSFVMVFEKDKSQLQKITTLFTVISDVSVGEQTILLLKNAVNLTDNVVYIPIIHNNTFTSIPQVQNELNNSKRIVLVSENQQYDGVLGLVKNLMKIYSDQISLIIVDDNTVPAFHCDTEIFKKQLDKNLKINILRKGQWGGEYYIQSDTSFEANHKFSLTCSVPNDIDSLKWVEKPLLAPTCNLVQVCYSAVSQIDIRKVVYNDLLEQSIGMDFSGFDYNGHKVMGIVTNGALATQVEADSEFVWPIPDHWSLEDAATVPLPYILAYYCLTIKSQIRSEFLVLVTSGAGALGQAMISVCLGIGCKVFTTVSDTNKKKFLLKIFPELDEQNIVCSHDSSFYDAIRSKSKKYCDIVVNCKNGILRESALKCLGTSGCFIDLSTFDCTENQSFRMSYLSKERNYYTTQLLNIFAVENNHEKKMLHGLISEGISKGLVKPLTRVVYSPLEVSKAFRLISSSRSRGRVLISMNDPTTQHLKILPNITCSAKSTYVVVCDKNEMAVEVIDELIRKGAKYLIMHVKSEESSLKLSGYMVIKLHAWKKLNVVVEISSEPLHIEKNCAKLLTNASKLGPVHGIFIVLDSVDNDLNYVNQSKFVNKFINTATIVSDLDLNSRQICQNLRYFAVLMSTTQNPADIYNSATVEKICQSRNEMGLPALVYNIAINNQLTREESDFQSMVLQSMPVILNGLFISLKLKHNNVQVLINLMKHDNSGVLQKISRIFGVNHIDDIDENLTVSELVVVDTNIMEIKSIIKKNYEIDYTYEKIMSLPIASLKQLHQKYKKQKANFDGGLNTFFTYVDEDECLASEPMVAVVTKANNTVEISDTHLSSNEAYLMMIPGFDGHYQVFNSICKTLKLQARILQLGPDLRANSISQIANDMLKFLKSRFTLQSKFYLMGYSFGVNVALELAALIEKEGFTGVVYCLDSSPDALRAQLDAYLGELTNIQLQNSIVEHIYRLLSGHSSNELSNDLQQAKSFPDKIQVCINKFKGVVKFSNEYKESIILSAYQRILLAQSYAPDFKLQSQIVLIKGIPHPNQIHLPDDYNLSQYTYQPVQVFNIKSDHALAPDDCRVTNILNKFVDPQILQEFNKKNLCESYITTATNSSTLS